MKSTMAKDTCSHARAGVMHYEPRKAVEAPLITYDAACVVLLACLLFFCSLFDQDFPLHAFTTSQCGRGSCGCRARQGDCESHMHNLRACPPLGPICVCVCVSLSLCLSLSLSLSPSLFLHTRPSPCTHTQALQLNHDFLTLRRGTCGCTYEPLTQTVWTRLSEQARPILPPAPTRPVALVPGQFFEGNLR
jgi:hypothetical protein